MLEDDTESNEAWQDILRLLPESSLLICMNRYGYTEESKRRIDEIDAKLAEFDAERQRYQIGNVQPQESDDEASSQQLPALVPEKSNQHEDKEVVRPEKVIGDTYLKEQVFHGISGLMSHRKWQLHERNTLNSLISFSHLFTPR